MDTNNLALARETGKQAMKFCIGFYFLLFFILTSCNNTEPLTTKQANNVKDSVNQMMSLLAKDISQNGPIAWLVHFENTPNFFMASDGQLVFQNNDSAATFIKNILVKQIRTIELHWSDIRIDPLTLKFANFAANWHEDITDFAGNKMPYDGYFTGIVEKTSQDWQLRNAHWSLIKPK